MVIGNTVVTIHHPIDVDRMIRTLHDDTESSQRRTIKFIEGEHKQIVLVETQREAQFAIYSHEQDHLIEVLENIEGAIGFTLPDALKAGMHVYNTGCLLPFRGHPVPVRTFRQQIFLGGSIWPINQEQTSQIVFHGVGNAIWNFLDRKVWGTTKSAEMKRQYQTLRGLPPRSERQSSDKQQNQLFHIASEDFRFLFGTAEAGAGVWHMENDQLHIGPPNPEVMNFWRREIGSYGKGHTSETAQDDS